MATATKVFNDCVHGHIELNPLCVAIIDTPQFQRLRHIKQLGGCYYVFPGASHNRFEHSIGVCFLAGQLIETLKFNQPELNITDREVLCVKIAGLCHDLGHGPFSHLFEGFLHKAKPDYKSHHEGLSLLMFNHLLDEHDIIKNQLSHNDQQFIKELIQPPPKYCSSQWYQRICREIPKDPMTKSEDQMAWSQYLMKIPEDPMTRHFSTSQQLKMSECVDDMVAFSKLTDHVYHEILHGVPKVEALGEAANVLCRLEQRKLYRCICQTKPVECSIKVSIEDIRDRVVVLSHESMTADDFEILEVRFDYGMREKNPVDSVLFYEKTNPKNNPKNAMYRVTKLEKVSMMLPANFCERILQFFWKKSGEVPDEVYTAIDDWLKENKVWQKS